MTKRRKGKEKIVCTSGNMPFCLDSKCPVRKNLAREMDRQLFNL